MRSSVVVVAAVLSLAGCSPPKEGVTLAAPPRPPARGDDAQAAAPPADAPAAEPHEGRCAFVGIVRPRKGGYDVSGVFFDDGPFEKAIAANVDGVPADREWFLGAKVRVVATLREHVGPAPAREGMEMQARSSGGFDVVALEAVTLVKRAERIEGTLSRSKGFFALEGHLVTRDDVAAALPGGGKEGDRVRLRGQSRVVVCEPNAQCLLGGSLPLFDVARGERLP